MTLPLLGPCNCVPSSQSDKQKKMSVYPIASVNLFVQISLIMSSQVNVSATEFFERVGQTFNAN